MKRLLAILALAMTAVMLVAGCGSSAPTGGKGGTGVKTSGEKVLKVGCSPDFAPFEFQEEGKREYQGFDIDLIKAIGKEMGYKVEIANVSFDNLIPDLEANRIDLIVSAMSINQERSERVLFSEPYYELGLAMAVKDSNDSIKTFADLTGKRVAVQGGTFSAEEMHQRQGVEVTDFTTVSDCFTALKVGKVDAVVNDRPVNDYFITRQAMKGVKVLPDMQLPQSYGIAVNKKNTSLHKQVNEALAKLKANGEYDKIFAKWFGNKK